MEKHKYLPPKFSFALRDMAKYYGKTPSQISCMSVSAIDGFESSLGSPKESQKLRTIKEAMVKKSRSNTK